MTFAITMSPLLMVVSFSFGNSMSIDSGATIAGEMNRRNMKAPRAGNFASGQTSFLREFERHEHNEGSVRPLTLSFQCVNKVHESCYVRVSLGF